MGQGDPGRVLEEVDLMGRAHRVDYQRVFEGKVLGVVEASLQLSLWGHYVIRKCQWVHMKYKA